MTDQPFGPALAHNTGWEDLPSCDKEEEGPPGAWAVLFRCLRRSLLIGQLHPYNRGGHEESHPPVHLSHEPDRWDGVRYLRV